MLELVSAGLLPATAPARGATWHFSPRAIDQLLSSIKDRASAVCVTDMKPVPWHLRHSLRPPRTLATVIAAMISGSLPYAWNEDGAQQGMAAVRICRSKIQEWQQPANGTFSVQQAAELMGIKQEIAYALVRAGLLAARKEGRGQRITVGALTKFRQTYVFASDIAKRRGSSPRAIVERPCAAGVAPLEVEHMRSRRQVLYERQRILESPLKGILAESSLNAG